MAPSSDAEPSLPRRGRAPPVAGPGRTPDGQAYWDPHRLAVELEAFYYSNWICVAREEDLAGGGDYLTRRVGRESLLLVRDPSGGILGFYNLCRHRGTRVVLPESGRAARSFICPYHAWSYDTQGRLIGAPHMNEQPEFDRHDFGLHPVRTDTWGGFVWVNLAPSGVGLTEALGPFFRKFDRFPLDRLRRGARQVYEVEANWKILVENFSECYHCAPVHPSLNRLTPYRSGNNDASFRGGRSGFSGGFMEFAGDFESMTRSGYTRRPRIPGMTAEDRRRVYYYVLFPNSFFSLHPDYLMIHHVWPTSPSHSRVENEFYFTPEAVADPAFDPRDATELWDEINRQDWAVCELAQEGMGSRAWTGGRYSDAEELVRDFDEFVEGKYAALSRDGDDPGPT